MDSNAALTPEQMLVSLLSVRSLTVACAESCTGGLIMERITALPGVSAVMHGGVVSYSNEVKMKLLGVRAETLTAFGAVSEEVAREMAQGVRAAAGASIALSVTGVAGPSGGTADKPVGCVCFSVCGESGTVSRRMLFGENKSRDEIRRLTADYAMKLAADFIERGTECLKK